MTKRWAIIAARRPHLFSLGKVEDDDEALAKAEEFCARKNEELKKIHEKIIPAPQSDPLEYVVLAILNEDDLRGLTGEIHRPYVIASVKREVAVETPTKRGATDTGGGGTTEQQEESDNEG